MYFHFGIVLNSKHTNCLILILTKYLQVEMYFSLSKKQEIMTATVMGNGIDFLMKELKKRSSSSHHCSDSSSSSKKDSVIWTIQAVTVHLEVQIYLHKVGRKIIS
jgi:regulatory protein YycH of two-component signal transduction system YycFG